MKGSFLNKDAKIQTLTTCARLMTFSEWVNYEGKIKFDKYRGYCNGDPRQTRTPNFKFINSLS